MRSIYSHIIKTRTFGLCCCWGSSPNVHYLEIVDWFNNKEQNNMDGNVRLNNSFDLLLPPKFKIKEVAQQPALVRSNKPQPKPKMRSRRCPSAKTHIHTDHPKTTLRLDKALCPKIATAFEPVTAVAKNQNQFPERERENRTGNAGKNETKLLRCQSQSAAFYLSEYETTACCSIADRSDVYGKFDSMKTLRAIPF